MISDPLYTAYGFKLDTDTSIRPCGMNSMFALDNKPLSNKVQSDCADRAFKSGYDTIVFFKDDKSIRTVELW